MSALEGVDFTDEEWREYQSIPEQGYSHRGWLNHRNRKVMARLLAEVWDEGHDDGQINEHEFRERRRITNPYRIEDDA